MAVDVPIGAQVTQETPALGHRQPLPEQRHVVAPGIEHRPPVDAQRARRARPRGGCAGAAGARRAGPRATRGRRPARRRVLARQQAVARERQDRSAMAAVREQDRDVDHLSPLPSTSTASAGSIRARLASSQGLAISRGPMPSSTPGAGGSRGGRLPMQSTARSAARALPSASVSCRPPCSSASPTTRWPIRLQRDVGRRRGLGAVQKVAQIAAVDAARDEGMARRRDRRRRMLGQIVRPQPAQEVGRIGRERAHVGDPRVEQQPVVAGGEGDARARRSPTGRTAGCRAAKGRSAAARSPAGSR